MEICNELTRESEINDCFVSRIIQGNYIEIARHNKCGITCDCALLDKTLSLFITARCSMLAAIISSCREIQKIDIRVELCHKGLQR